MKTELLTGIVQSGGTDRILPLEGASIIVCEATEKVSFIVGTGKTNSEGRFSIEVSRSALKAVYYVLVDMDDGVQLACILGKGIPGSVTINELTTVAAAYCMAQFMRNGSISGDVFGMGVACLMNANLVDTATGESSVVLKASPNADQTIALRTTRSLANLLAACVQKVPGATSTLLQLATPPYGSAPVGTFQAMGNIARYPGQNVSGIHAQSALVEMYQPPLVFAPDAWTIAVKVHHTGSEKIPFGGPGNIVFDHRGFAWITNNAVQGKPVSTVGVVVLKPDGKPADGGDGTAVSPVVGGGILGTGFGIDIDPQGSVWIGNFGWGGVNPGPDGTGTGSVSKVSATGEPISVPHGYDGGTDRVQGIVSDEAGNIWIASFSNNRVVVFPKGNPDAAFWYQEDDVDLPPKDIIEILKHTPFEVPPKGSAPFGIAIAFDGSAWVTNSGGLASSSPSSLCKYVIVDGALQRQFKIKMGHALKGIALDSMGNAWIASGGEDTVYLMNPDGELLGKFSGGAINGPWSVTVDGNDDVWVANFGPMAADSNYTTASLTQLAGMRRDTFWPDVPTGSPISPPTGYTLRSAGEEVLLSNRDPLYGPGSDPCFIPLMRQTNCVIDQAGNVWTINNWKPDFKSDAQPGTGNPGGDGIVIFVGIAAPPPKKR